MSLSLPGKYEFREGKEMANVIVVLLLHLGVEARIDGDMTFIYIVGVFLCMGNIHIKVSWACAFLLLRRRCIYMRLQ